MTTHSSIQTASTDVPTPSRRSIPADEDRFARTALWGDLITPEQFAECVDEQARAAAAGRDVPSLPELLVEKGYLPHGHADAVYRAMTTHTADQWSAQFGQIASRKGFITEAQLREALEEQARLILSGGAAPILGHLLIERGHMTEKQVLAILKAQERRHLGALHELEAAVQPPPGRVRAWLRRYRRPLLAVAGVLALGLAGATGAVAHSMLPALARYDLLCDHCGHRQRVAAAAIATPCSQCGKGRLHTALHCIHCGRDFPLKVNVSADDTPWIEHCPRCRNLHGVRLPRELEPLRRNTKPRFP